jgi:polyphosphate kinase
MTPIYEQSLSLKLLDLLNLQLNDNVLAWELQHNGEYKLCKIKEGEKPINSQTFLEQYVNRLYKATKKTTSSNNLTKKKKIFK